MRAEPDDRARARTRSTSRSRRTTRSVSRASSHRSEMDIDDFEQVDVDSSYQYLTGATNGSGSSSVSRKQDEDENDNNNDDDEDLEDAANEESGSDNDHEQDEDFAIEDQEMDETAEEALEDERIHAELSRSRSRSRGPPRSRRSSMASETKSRRNSSVGFGTPKRATFVGRPVANFSDNDKMIVYMKHLHYSDSQIANAVSETYHELLDPKQIHNRYVRTVKAEQEEWDYDLDNGLKEWSEKNDEHLVKAHEEVEAEIESQIARIQERRFEMVSNKMRQHDSDVRYSARACTERYSALADGTAYVPCDADQENGERRVADLEEKRKEHDEDELRRKEEAEEAQRQEDELLQQRKDLEQEKKKERAQARYSKLQAEAMRDLDRLAEKNAALLAAKRSAQSLVHGSLDAVRRAEATDDFRADPRQHLTREQIKKLCKDKGVNHHGTKLELLGRIRTKEHGLSNKVLRETCALIKRPIGGTKDQLLYRIAENDTRQFLKPDNPTAFIHPTSPLTPEPEDEEKDALIADADGIRMSRAHSVAYPQMKMVTH